MERDICLIFGRILDDRPHSSNGEAVSRRDFVIRQARKLLQQEALPHPFGPAETDIYRVAGKALLRNESPLLDIGNFFPEALQRLLTMDTRIRKHLVTCGIFCQFFNDIPGFLDRSPQRATTLKGVIYHRKTSFSLFDNLGYLFINRRHMLSPQISYS